MEEAVVAMEVVAAAEDTEAAWAAVEEWVVEVAGDTKVFCVDNSPKICLSSL